MEAGDRDSEKIEDSTSLDEDDDYSGPHISQPKPPKPRFYSKYNILSHLMLIWLDPLIWTGFWRPLTQSDLYAHPDEVDSEKLLKRFNRHWNTELDRKKNGRKPRLFIALMKCIWWRFGLHGIFQFSEISLQVVQSILLGYLADTFNTSVDDLTDSTSTSTNFTIASEGNSNRNAYLYAGGISFLALILVLIHGHTFLLAYKMGLISRLILTGAIYQKLFSLSQVIVGRVTIGRIVNLASNDVQRLDLAFLFVHIFWVGVFHLAVVTYLVYLEVGWCSFLILGFVCVQIPLQVCLARSFSHLRFKSAVLTDQRIRIMNEIITGIRVIKMYAWEHAFKRVIEKLRKRESFIIMQAGLIRATSLGFMISSLTMMMYIVFTVYAATGGIITPKKVFTTLSLLILLRITTVHFAIQAILSIVEGKVASVRIQELLEMNELDVQQGKLDYQEDQKPAVNASIVVKNVSASWFDDNSKLVLNNINFSVTKDHNLLAIIGPVGSGKSTLLQCLLDELKPMEGSIKVNGSVAYASQDSWIYSATLRENILFGKPYDRKWYKTVISACALDKDIELLVNGDLTLVGERGVTLSGGQKARVNLARAVYHDADIYLLDDPLSAVDTAVGKHLFEECICGLLKDRLIVLVTHQVHFALLAKEILVIKEGCIDEHGSYSELLSKGVNLLGVMSSDSPVKEENDMFTFKDIDGDKEVSSDTDANSKTTRFLNGESSNETDFLIPSPLNPGEIRRRNHNESYISMNDLALDISPFDTTSIFTSKLSLDFTPGSPIETQMSNDFNKDCHVAVLPEEEKEQGTISVKTYYQYFTAGGNVFLLIMVMLFFIIAEIGITVTDWWLADWAACNVAPDNTSLCSLDNNERLYIFSGLTLFAIVVNFIRAIAFYFICVNASRILHNRMFKAILRAPVLFFDTNPIGRILNRFSKDVGFLDDLLPYIFCEFLLLFFRCLAILGTSIVSNWWVVFPAVALMIILLLIRGYYLKTAREVKRLEAIARSPVFSHLSTTLQGLSTIRTFRKQHIAVQHFHQFQNEHTQGWFHYIVITRWLGLRLDALCGIFITIVSLASVGLSSYDITDVSLIGLSLTYIISLTAMFQYVVRQSVEVENLMVSSERVMAYSRLESEASLETVSPNQKPPEDWPSKGELCLEDVAFQYSSDLPMVLKNLSFSVKPSEKVGIVGRTGAGKSSLLSVLYRLAEPLGRITIDGIDTKSIGLHDLRKKMSIIPQDPVLFSGNMRYNLDPFDEYSDAELWKVLEQVQLKSEVEGLEGQLSGEVSEGGSNFSVGQRQLVCLARALLRKNKILILDEATANVDPRTDGIIQDTLREIFSDCTVLTIAHRLNTIMDSDRILVMHSGEAVELDSPLTLLQNKKSHFFMMVAKTGPEASRKLYEMALETERQWSRGYVDDYSNVLSETAC